MSELNRNTDPIPVELIFQTYFMPLNDKARVFYYRDHRTKITLYDQYRTEKIRLGFLASNFRTGLNGLVASSRTLVNHVKLENYFTKCSLLIKKLIFVPPRYHFNLIWFLRPVSFYFTVIHIMSQCNSI